MWERYGILPKHLHGVRDSRNWRWWTEEQVRGIEAFAASRYPGSGLSWYKPSPEQVQETIDKMRTPTRERDAA